MRLPGPRLDIGQSLVWIYLAVQLLSTPLFIDLDILVSQSLVMFVMFICLLSIVYLSMAFDQLVARQPGFISISLHRSLDGRRIVNYVQWQSRDLLQSAHKSPEFRKEWGKFDQLADEIDPHLYEVVHVMDSGE